MVDPLFAPELTRSGCVGSASSGKLAEAGGLEAFASNAGSTPEASGFVNGPTWRIGGVWFGEMRGGLVESGGGGLEVPPPDDRVPLASYSDGLGNT